MEMREPVALLVLVGLMLSACGGESRTPQEEPAAASAARDSAEPDETTMTTDAPATQEPKATSGEGTGSATIGDMAWDYALSGRQDEVCNSDLLGSFVVVMYGQDANGTEVLLSITAGASGAPVVVQAGQAVVSAELWVADQEVYDRFAFQELPEGIGATVTVDGTSISGSGVFYEDRSLSATRQTGEPYETGVLEGTFSATCPAA
jgi:hypothetical protein